MIKHKADEITFSFGFPTVGIMKTKEYAVIPHKAHQTDAGLDLCAAETVTIPPMGTAVISSGIAVDLPKGFEADIRGRSGKTSKTPLRVQLGTVDAGYTGEIGIICDNFHLTEPLVIKAGDKIAQMVIFEFPKYHTKEVGAIGDKDRGNNGFGSTGERVDA